MTFRDRKWAGRLVWVVLAAALLFFSSRVYYRLTDDFRLANITFEMPANPEWDIPSLSLPEQHLMRLILEQPFSYIGKGGQSYVFASADGQYVIKFFKFKHLRPNWLVEALPEIGFLKEYKESNIARKKRLIQGVFSGYRVAYEKHRSESGILFLKLNPQAGIYVTLHDKLGRKHHVNLEKIPFIIQEKARPTRDIIEAALNVGDLALVKQRMRQIVALYHAEYTKGIVDRDHGILHNTGFVGEKPIHLDVGKVSARPEINQPENRRADLEIVYQRYTGWLKNHYPHYYEELAADFHAAIE